MVQRELVKGTTMVRNYLTRLAQAAMVHCAERWSNHPAEDHLDHLVEIFQRRPHPVRLVEHPQGNECVEGTGERETFTCPGRNMGDAAVEAESTALLVKTRQGGVKLAAGFCWPHLGWVA